MGTPNPGRWIVAALVVGCATLGVTLALRGCLDDAPSVESSARTRAAVAPSPTATSVPVASTTRPLRRHPKAPDVAADPASSKGGYVVVRVTTAESDAPITDATVAVPDLDNLRRTTGADGVARFGPLEAVGWEFRASAPGRIAEYGRCTVEIGKETTIALRLEPAVDLSVRVEDRRTGAPIAGAKLHRVVAGAKIGLDLETDTDGRCVVPSRTDSVVRLTAKAPGFEDGETVLRTGAAGSAAEQVVLRLVTGGRLTGTVRGADGSPVARARIFVVPASTPIDDPVRSAFEYRGLDGRPETLTDTTADDGGFVINHLVPGRRYHAVASDFGRKWADSETAEHLVFAPDDEERVRDFVLRPLCDVVVRLVRPDGTPASDATLTVGSGKLGGIVLLGMKSTSPGVFSLPARMPGALELIVSGTSRRIDVPSGPTFEFTIEVGPPPEVRGNVVDEAGRPVAGATIDLSVPSSRTFMSCRATSDADGAFRTAVFEAGPTNVNASAPGYLPTTGTTLAAPSDDARIVLRRAATLTFRAASGGAPTPRAYIHMFFDDEVSEALPNAPSGSIRVDRAPNSDTQFRAFVAGCAPVVRRVRLDAGVVLDLGDVDFPAARKLRGRVVDASGRPVGGATVDLDSGPGRSSARQPTTDANGEFAGDLAPPSGPVPLRVEAVGFLPLRKVVTVDGDAPITLTLSRGGLLWGETVDAAGAPWPDAKLHVVEAQGRDVTTTADRHGFFDVRLAPGRYSVRADGSDDAATVDLGEGGDARVRVVASPRVR